MAGPALDRVLQRLSGVQAHGAYYKARCPAHDDQVQSLQVSERSNDLSVGLFCHAGCDTSTIVGAMNLTWADLFSPLAEKDGSIIVAEYDYRSLTGELLYQTVRYFPKNFKQRRPDGHGGWIWNMGPHKKKRVPYRLPQLKGCNTIFVVEGEKDADRLWDLGFPATTNVGGAKKWGLSESQCLKAAGATSVIIIADNDETGHDHVGIVGSSVNQVHLTAKELVIPDLTLHGDVSDWLDNGGSKEQLQELVDKLLTPSQPEPEPPAPIIITLPDALPDPLQYKIGSTVGAGAAESFRDRYKDKLRYDHTREAWYVWSGHRWQCDTDEEVMRLALQHSRRWGQEVISAAPDYQSRKQWTDYTLKLERRPDRMAMLADARALPPFAGTPKWDMDPWLLGVPNGVVDLQTSKLRDGVPTDWLSQQVGPHYQSDAECPRWLQFLDEVFDGDPALIDYVHKAVGYSLTADMREQCFFLAYGTGSNGKSIFLNTLEALVGSYGTRASMRLFIGDVSEFHMAELLGARMIFASESKPDTRLNEHVIKSLTGGETQQAERKHQHPFRFRPVGKIWLGVNHVPKVLDDSFGFWRRVRLVPFDQTFTGTSEDRQLRDKLVAELPGILTWAIKGAAAWIEHGLEPPPKVIAATAEYQTGEDPLVEFIAERCKLDPTGVETFSALLAAYNRWADSQKIARADRLTRRGLGIHLKRRFTTKDLDGVRRYGGVRLISQGPPDNLYSTPEYDEL